MNLPTDSAARKGIPLAEGLLYYFPAALAAVAAVSKAGNDKHNPGQPMHHARGKSMDHADCIMRHLADAGTVDAEDGLRHSAKVAWRALALLQEELEREEGAPLPRNARLTVDPVAALEMVSMDAPVIAFIDGFPVTAADTSSQALPPQIEALQERAMADDPQVGGLKAGEADHA